MIWHRRHDDQGACCLLALAVGIWLCSESVALAFGDGPDHVSRHWGHYGYGPHLNYRGHGLDDFGYPFFTYGAGHAPRYQHPGYPYGTPGVADTGYPFYRDFGQFTGAPPNPERFATAVHRAATQGGSSAPGLSPADRGNSDDPASSPGGR